MTQDKICSVCKPFLSDVVEVMQDAFHDFDEAVKPEFRPSTYKARAMFTSCRIAERMALKFGRERGSKIWTQELDGNLNTLIIRGDEFDVALRMKKFDHGYQVYQHESGVQNELRKMGQFPKTLFPDLMVPTAHVFLGYRATKSVTPKLLDIALSYERATKANEYYVDWHRIIWSETAGFDADQTFTESMFPVDVPTYDIKPKGDIALPQASGKKVSGKRVAG